MKIWILLLLLCAPVLAEDWQIVPGVRAGAIGAHITERQLVKLYGKDQVIREQYRVAPDGEPETVTMVWPKDPKRLLRVVWAEGMLGEQPSALLFEGEESRWTAAPGISLGTSLEKLEKLNGQPFHLSGFGWDYGGSCSFRQGALRNWDLGLVLGGGNYQALKPGEVQSISGDRDLLSSLPVLHRFKPVVTRIFLNFKRKP